MGCAEVSRGIGKGMLWDLLGGREGRGLSLSGCMGGAEEGSLDRLQDESEFVKEGVRSE